MKLLSRRASLIVTLIILTIFVGYFALNVHKFRPLLQLNLLLLLIIAAANILSIAVSGVFTMLILRPFGKRIPMLESFYISLLSSVGNFFAPAGAGFAFRAVYLRHRFNFPYSKYISTLSGNYILVFLVNSFFGLVSLYLLRSRHDSQYSVLVLAFAIVFAAALSLSLFKLPVRSVKRIKSPGLHRVAEIVYRITKGWNFIVAHRWLMAQLTILTTVNLFITMGITWVIIQALHLTIAIGPLLLFSVLGSLSLFINITPANLGIKEGIYLFSSSVLGFSTTQILSIALVDRGVMFSVLLILWLFSSKIRTHEKLQTDSIDQVPMPR